MVSSRGAKPARGMGDPVGCGQHVPRRDIMAGMKQRNASGTGSREAGDNRAVDAKARQPEIPWQKVAGIGNLLRHNCESIAAPISPPSAEPSFGLSIQQNM